MSRLLLSRADERTALERVTTRAASATYDTPPTIDAGTAGREHR